MLCIRTSDTLLVPWLLQIEGAGGRIRRSAARVAETLRYLEPADETPPLFEQLLDAAAQRRSLHQKRPKT